MANIRIRRLPLRLATGAFILNSGISKLRASDETAAQIHGFAKGTYPFLERVHPTRFTKLLAGGEVAVGSALLLPIIPAGLAGAALAGFSSALLGLYLKTPGMRQAGSLRPSEQGIPLAKDVWMVGIGTALMLDWLGGRGGVKEQTA